MSGSANDGQRNRDDRTSEEVQSHDPLCGYRLHHFEESPECDMCRCDCDLIARVRAYHAACIVAVRGAS